MDLNEYMKKIDLVKAISVLNRVTETKIIADGEEPEVAAAIAMAEITAKMLENLEPAKKLLCKKTESFHGDFIYNLPRIDSDGKIIGADKRNCSFSVGAVETPKVSYDSEQLKKDYGITVEEEPGRTIINWGKDSSIKEAFAESSPTIKPKYMAGAISSGKLDKKYEIIKTTKSVTTVLTMEEN